VPSERCSIEEQSIEYRGWACCVAHHVTRHNTPIHNILSTAPQLSISQKALGTLPEDGNVMPKHVGATIHN
jgi:heterodisulfide reductase subunit B